MVIKNLRQMTSQQISDDDLLFRGKKMNSEKQTFVIEYVT